MKKMIIPLTLLMLTFTGCDASKMDTMTCTYENETNGIKTKIVNSIDYQDTEVKKINMTYSYDYINNNNEIDGVGTGTDGTTNDSQKDKDGIVDGVVGDTFDSIINGVTDTILDIAGLKDRHQKIQEKYNSINGFSAENVTDTDMSYKTTYILDFDTITEDELTSLNLSRDLSSLKNIYIQQGYYCK